MRGYETVSDGQADATIAPDSASEYGTAVLEKVWQRYGKYPPHIVKQRLRAELEIIMPNGYDVIYMTARELVAGLLAAGYPIGFRGCLGASFVAYLLGITDIDPLPPHYRCPHCHYSKFPPKADMPFDLASGTLCGADLPDKVYPNAEHRC